MNNFAESVNSYVQSVLPYEEALEFQNITFSGNSRSPSNNVPYQERMEDFIMNLPKSVRDKLIKALSVLYEMDLKMTPHCLARFIARFGELPIDFTVERSRYAVETAMRQTAKARKGFYSNKHPERGRACDITVVYDSFAGEMLTIYPTGLKFSR